MAAPPLPPQCPGSFLLGNTRALLKDTGALLTDGHRRFGPLFRLRVGWFRYTVIAGPEARDFLAQGLDEAHLSRHRIFGAIQNQFGPADLVLAQSGERHTRLRPPLSVAFSRQTASPFVPALVAGSRAHAARWPAGARLGVLAEAQRMAFDQFLLLMGDGATALDYRDCRLVTEYGMNVGGRLLPALVFRTPWYRAAHRRAFTTLREVVRRRRQAGSSGPATIVDTLLAAHDAAGVPLTDDEVVTYCAYGIAASCAYVGRHVAFMLYEILKDAALGAEVVAEVQRACARGLMDATDVRGMRLLRSVYDETLRFHPISPGMPFNVEHDFEHLGRRVPKGDVALLSPVPTSFSPELFPDPHRFDAARCREPRNEHRQAGPGPFGLGNRTCVAMGLVELMAMTLVASVLAERQVEMEPPGYQLGLTIRPLPAPNRAFRMHVGGAPAAPPTTTPPVRATEDDAFAAFPGHDDPVVRQMMARATPRAFPAGALIIREGDPADTFFIVVKGTVTITKGAGGTSRHLADLGEGEWFGEIGLLQNSPRTATVTAGAGGVDTLMLDRDAFLGMVTASDLVASEIASLLRRRVAIARLQQAAPQLDVAATARVLPEFEWRAYQPGQVIIREGDAADAFFVIVHGEVEVSRQDARGVDATLARLGPGEYFGEIGLLHGTRRNATVAVARSSAADVLVADREGFRRFLDEAGSGELARGMLARVERLG